MRSAQESLTSSVLTGTSLYLTGPSSSLTISDGAQLSSTSPYVSGAFSTTSQCQPTLTYIPGEPYPTGCYQTTVTETLMATITAASQMTITHGVSTIIPPSGDPNPSSQVTITQSTNGSITNDTDPAPSSQLTMAGSETTSFTLSELHVEILGTLTKLDYQDIEPNATKSDVKKALASNRYRLGYYDAGPGSHRFGLVKVTQTEPWQVSSSQYDYTALDNPSQPCENKSRPPRWSNFLNDGLSLLLLLTLFGLILGYYLDGNQTDSLKFFFSSNTFGPRFLLSSLAVLISVGWKGAERETRIMEPYRQLASCLKPGKGTIDVTMTGTSYCTVFIALRRGDLLQWPYH